VTNAAYHRFIASTGHRAPGGTEVEWQRYGLVHAYATVRKFLWQERQPPPGRAAHPVVLVSKHDAAAYCAWRGEQEGRRLRLSTEAEWEKAARGTDGRYFPWGNTFDPTRLNSYDKGPYDTVPVGQYPQGQSPYGVLDMAGQVFEWTATRLPSTPLTYIVKGGSWDDLPGMTRAAARHDRPADLKHILIGFRCVAGPPTAD
jgi:formylglycine-generating enzyme required for sulfatase activity